MKRFLTITMCFLLIGAVFAACKAKPETEPESETATVQATSEITQTTQPESTSSTAGETQQTQQTTEKSADVSFLKKGCWYFYNDAELCAFAFIFDGKGNVSMAYFDPANVSGEDPQYFEGGAKYTVRGSELKITSLPAALGLKEFVFTITENGLSYQDVALDHQDRLSLDYPFEHFNS